MANAIILNAGAGYANGAEVLAGLPSSVVGAYNRTFNINWTGASVNSAGEVTGISYSGNSQNHSNYSIGDKSLTSALFVDAPTSGASSGSASTNGFGTIRWKSGANTNGEAADAIRIAMGITGESAGFGAIEVRNTAIATNFHVSRVGATIRFVHKTNDNNFDIVTVDGLAGAGLSSIFRSVNDITDLPKIAPNQFKVKVVGDAELDQDDYYVEFETHDNSIFSGGSWNEASGFDQSVGLDPDTMPMTIVSKGKETMADGTILDAFDLTNGNWSERFVGDEDTNPMPSFVDRQVTNMFFFKNRLGFISDDNVIMSEAGEPFNFFRNTTTVLLDSAPIDIQVSSNKVTNLKEAIAFQENLIIFAENGQYVLKGGELLSPNTVSVTPITSYDYQSSVAPLSLGSYVYFPFTRGGFSGVREFTINSTTDTYDSVDITEQAPAYLPSGIVAMTGSSSENLIAMMSNTEPDTIYIYTYFWNNRQKVLSSWSKFKIDGKIRALEFIKSKLYIVTCSAIGNQEVDTNLLEMSLETGLRDSTTGPNILLDYKHTPTSSTIPFNANGKTLKCYNKATGLEVGIGKSDTNYSFPTGSVLSSLVVGVPYTMKYKFSDQIFKGQSGNSQTPSNASNMQLRNGTLFMTDTNSFDVKVTPSGKTEETTSFSADNEPTAVLNGTINQVDGKFRFPIYAQGRGTSIVVEDSGSFPVKLNAAEFESFVSPRSKRYG